MQKLSIIIYVTLIIAVFVISGLLINNLLNRGSDFFNSLSTSENTKIPADTNKITNTDSITYVIDQPAEDAVYPNEVSTNSPVSADSIISEEAPVINNKAKDESPEH